MPRYLNSNLIIKLYPACEQSSLDSNEILDDRRPVDDYSRRIFKTTKQFSAVFIILPLV